MKKPVSHTTHPIRGYPRAKIEPMHDVPTAESELAGSHPVWRYGTIIMTQFCTRITMGSCLAFRVHWPRDYPHLVLAKGRSATLFRLQFNGESKPAPLQVTYPERISPPYAPLTGNGFPGKRGYVYELGHSTQLHIHYCIHLQPTRSFRRGQKSGTLLLSARKDSHMFAFVNCWTFVLSRVQHPKSSALHASFILSVFHTLYGCVYRPVSSASALSKMID